jgi:osmotically-inducible protein OsmY
MKKATLLIAILVFGISIPAFAIRIGFGDFYINVGDYDYLPYNIVSAPQYAPSTINFGDMMSQYGSWATDQQFGKVWQPYSAQGWRPYMHGRWMNTQYGPTWEGYEPWAWAAYHYGDWIYKNNTWAWVPGYDWHPGRVAWAQGMGSIGWMPMPPSGYDYSRGYLAPAGTTNQFDYYDSDFGSTYSSNPYTNGGPYYNPQFREAYYNPAYMNNVGNLWTFIDTSGFTSDDYADYYLGTDYARMAFDQRAVRVAARPITVTTLQQIVRQTIPETPVETRQIQTETKPIRVVVPTSAEAVEKIRKNSNRVVKEVVAPAFAEKQKDFKGQDSKQAQAINKIFRQENVKPEVQEVDNQQIVRQAQEQRQQREANRKQRADAAKQKLMAAKNERQMRERTQAQPQQRSDKRPSEAQQQQRPPQQQEPSQPEQRRQEEQRAQQNRMRERTPQEQPEQPSQAAANDDGAITRQVEQKISNLPTLADDNINVSVENGVVVLRGSVNNPQNENRALSLAQSVPGVKSVRSEIEVKKGNTPKQPKKNKDQH